MNAWPANMTQDVSDRSANASADALLSTLRVLAEQPEVSQRQLSEALGLSLGKTHYVLHALLEKGLVKMSNFRRSDRKLAYAYVLTPRGLLEKVRLTKAFLSRKELEFAALQQTIAALKAELRSKHSDARDHDR
jgi:EPS-associated MarR family transcriptional regulator